MMENQTKASDLVMTQAELPPGIDAPSPSRSAGGTGHSSTTAGESPTDLLREIRQLADRVGGIDRLRELLDELAKMNP